jgi:Family of unknown function (DUF5677)
MATKLFDNGFFSDEAIQKSEAIKHRHKQLFFYLAEVNEKAHRYLSLWNVHSTNLKQVFAAALFARTLTAYQALIMLAQRGFASEARATCRNILEAKFKLAYLLKEPEAAQLLIAKGEQERIKRIRNMQSGDLPVPPEFSDQDWEPIIKQAEELFKNDKGANRKLLSIRQIAYHCGLKVDYLGHYSMFSEATHGGHIELQTYLKFNDTNTALEEFVYGPEDGDWVAWVTLVAAGYLIYCMEFSARIFRIRTAREFETLFKSLVKRNDDMMQRFRSLFLEEAKTKKPNASTKQT